MAVDGVILALSSQSAGTSELRRQLERRGMRIGIANPDRSDDLPVAVRSLDLSPAQCAVIAESRAYAEAARRAGVVCLALLSGDGSTDQLRSAGARAVYRDVAGLIDGLDAALALASPGSAHLTYDLMESLMREALTVAEEGMRNREAPIACVLARGDGKTIIARAHNEQNRTQNKTAHAEIVAFARAAGQVPLDVRDLLMVCTLEPCVMCTGAAMEAAVDTIIYALPAPADAGTQRIACPLSPESQMPRIVGGILARESRALFERFLKSDPRPEQARFARQLLALT